MFPKFVLTRRKSLASIGAFALLPQSGRAQSGGTVRVIVNTTAGSAVDSHIRAIAPALGQALGATLVIDNQAGASGLIGLQALARAPADGSTIGFASVNLAIFPSVMKSVPFDVLTDFSPIAIVGESPLVLVANAGKVPAANAKDFIALLKSKPTVFNFGSSGGGTILHLATELFLQEAGVKVNHIPYKGAAPMLNDTVSGQVDFSTPSLSAALPFIKSGQLRAIGLYTSARSAFAPDIPTLQEQGVSGAVVNSWHSVLGPKGMPLAVVKRMHDAVVAAFKDTGVRDAVMQLSITTKLQSPEETQATIRSDFAKYAKLVKAIALQPQ